MGGFDRIFISSDLLLAESIETFMLFGGWVSQRTSETFIFEGLTEYLSLFTDRINQNLQI